MKIAAVASEWSVKALDSSKFNPDLEWIWVEEVAALRQHRDVILYANRQFTDEAVVGQFIAEYPASAMYKNNDW